ncbi:MAG TPA: ATP-binding protein [Candidatus Limnocylindria bacterium]|nr:ATP-binding protein [Candidatus Limnocylindria bacterium]
MLRLYAVDEQHVIYVARGATGGVLFGKPFPHPELLVEAPVTVSGRGALVATSGAESRISEPYRDTPDSPILTTISAARHTWMTLAAEVDLTRVAERMAAELPPAEVYLVDKDGALLLPLSTGDRTRAVPAGRQILPAPPRDRDPYAVVAPDPIDGRSMLTAVAVVPETDWRIVVVRPSTVITEIEPVLDQVEAGRVLFVVLLLLGAAIVGVTGSQLVRQRRLLAATNAELARVSLEKSRFLANMSHELRTPLNAIIGFSQLLEERIAGPLNAKQSEYVRDVTESGKHQLALINDILDLSKVEAGKMEFRAESFDVADAVGRVHTLIAPLAEQKQVRLRVAAEDDLPRVDHDPGRFKQILYNLLSNAVKFTPEGGSVTTNVRASAEDRIEVSVADTGIGMSSDDVATIFDEFKRLDSDYARAQAGTGLGLALVKQLVEQMGGTIAVASEIGSGSTFTVRLPRSMPVLSAP